MDNIKISSNAGAHTVKNCGCTALFLNPRQAAYRIKGGTEPSDSQISSHFPLKLSCFQMTFNFVFVSVALVAVVLAGPGEMQEHRAQGKLPHGGPRGRAHGGPPAFLTNVSAEGKKEFENVFRNENLTLAQIDTQVAALAEKYGVAVSCSHLLATLSSLQALYKEFEANRTAHFAEVKKNTTAVIGNLSSVASQLATIYQNKDQTRKAQHEAVDAIRKEHRVEVDAVQFIREHFGRHGRYGGPREGTHGGKPHGKQNGGHRGEKNGQGEHGKKDKDTKQ